MICDVSATFPRHFRHRAYFPACLRTNISDSRGRRTSPSRHDLGTSVNILLITLGYTPLPSPFPYRLKLTLPNIAITLRRAGSHARISQTEADWIERNGATSARLPIIGQSGVAQLPNMFRLYKNFSNSLLHFFSYILTSPSQFTRYLYHLHNLWFLYL
jgi:hypothetical protein